MASLIYLAPVLGIVALLFAFVLAGKVNKMDEGTDRMQEIAASIREGARAFLSAEYKILVIFAAVLFILIGFGVSWPTAICFVVGAIFSTLAGFFGMTVATNANVRTANAARTGGMNKALSIAFSGGAVMGMCVVGLGLLGVGAIYVLTGNADILFGFSLGASSIALFARVGGGIYTKAADVGADLVGKVEAGIPEDDPRNPAVIADNVGDNVGDVAGMGADLYESYVGSIISASALGVAAFSDQAFKAMAIPMVMAAIGIICSIIGTFFVRTDEQADQRTLLKALSRGTNLSAILIAIIACPLVILLLGKEHLGLYFAILAGLIAGVLIGKATEYYTSDTFKPTQDLSSKSQTGAATIIIGGLGLGMLSTAVPIIIVAICILVAYLCSGGAASTGMGLYGIALAAVGMLSTLGITLATDAYGPIADNAGGIAEMSGLDHSVREITDKLDAVGNTTAAMGKGFAIGSAALTALALCAGVLTGCGGAASSTTASSTTGSAASSEVSGEEADELAAKNVADLIDAIYVQERTDDTDAQCEAAKAAWDALTDAQKELVEGEEADPDYFGRNTGDASKDDARNQDDIGNNELLVVSFGTSFNDSRVKDIKGIEDAIQAAYPDWSVRRAFTAQIIINHVQARDGEKIDNMQQAMDRAVENGVKNLVVQPTHLMHGAEYDEMMEMIDTYRDKFESVAVAEPLLGEVGSDATIINQDKEDVAKAVTAAAVKEAGYDSLDAAAADKVAFVFMGHGTSHTAKVSYSQMQTTMQTLGYDNVFIGTVEGKPEETACENVIEAVKAAGYTKVILRPLMVVAGDHANNDMAGSDDDSWKTMFEAADFTVDCQIAGLGEIADIQALYIAHTQAAIDALNA